MRQLRQALDELAALAHTRLLVRSPFYQTEPVGPPGQPDYVNAAAALDTRLTAQQLLAAMQTVELDHGRERRPDNRWGPRTLDLDLLLYADLQSDDPQLTLPHPRLHQRRFVLAPLADLAPDLAIPGRGRVADLLAACPDLKIIKLTEN